MTLPDPESLSRRAYLRAAVAVGGTGGLSACLETRTEDDREMDTPRGTPDERPERQHAWNTILPTDGDGNTLPPEHRVLVPIRLRTTPDSDASTQVEAAFERLEEAYAYDPDGLLFTVGYSPAYFDRLDGVETPIPDPEALTPMESPTFDDFDAIIHLASNEASVVLEAEQALFGGANPNGLDPEPLDDVFERTEPRRTGFVGEGAPGRTRRCRRRAGVNSRFGPVFQGVPFRVRGESSSRRSGDNPRRAVRRWNDSPRFDNGSEPSAVV